MTQITVDHNVAIPPKRATINGNAGKYPFHAMGVNDSFELLADSIEEKRRLQLMLHSASTHYRHQYAMKFTSRMTDKGVRIWRIA